MNLTLEPDVESLTETPDEPPLDNELVCVVCGNPLTYGGRGPKPKYCDDHKKQKPTVNAGSRGGGKSTDVLIGQIGMFYTAMGMGLTMIPPTIQDGLIISAEAGKLAESWRPLIDADPKIKKFWQKLTSGGGWGVMLASHASVAFAIMNAHNVQLPFFGTKPVEVNANGN